MRVRCVHVCVVCVRLVWIGVGLGGEKKRKIEYAMSPIRGFVLLANHASACGASSQVISSVRFSEHATSISESVDL